MHYMIENSIIQLNQLSVNSTLFKLCPDFIKLYLFLYLFTIYFTFIPFRLRPAAYFLTNLSRLLKAQLYKGALHTIFLE